MFARVRKRVPIAAVCTIVFLCLFVTLPIVFLVRDNHVEVTEIPLNVTRTYADLQISKQHQNESRGFELIQNESGGLKLVYKDPGGSKTLWKGSTGPELLQSDSKELNPLPKESGSSEPLQNGSRFMELLLQAASNSPRQSKEGATVVLRVPEAVERCRHKDVCASGFSKFQDQCYKVIKTDTPIDFTTAQRKCQTEGAALATDKTLPVHNYLKELLRPHLSESIDSQYRRAFIGLMCQNGCDSPGNWLYADGTKCEGNSFCDWVTVGSTNEWNALPTSLYGASIAAMLDDFPDTSYRYKLQPYPADHSLQYMICQKDSDSTEHLKPRKLSVNERLSNVVLEWQRPACSGDITSYILVLLGGSVSYDTEMRCTEQQCSFTLNPEDCNYCIHPNTDYTFSVAAVLSDSQLGPAITINKKIDVETCPNFETPFHTISTCRGVSEVVHDGSCENKITWSKGSMCDAVCETGFGFFDEPAPKYSCDAGGAWAPTGKAPECYEIVPVFSANLQFKITYKRASIETLQHQFDGLVYKYNDIFCPYPEECGIGDLQIKSALDEEGNKLSEVIVTIDTPVYNITDQVGFIDLVREAVLTVTEDNAFMTLIDYDNIALVLPIAIDSSFKAKPQLCCHSCPEGHGYRLGNCVRCPNPECA